MAALSDISPGGDRLGTLRVLRDELARWLDETDSARDRASLSLRFVDVLADIEEIEKASAPAAPVGSGVDEVTQRREARAKGA